MNWYRELMTLMESVGAYDPNAFYIHGGPNVLVDNRLKRYSKNRSDSGGIFLMKDTPENRKYSIIYTRHADGGALYRCKIKLSSDQIFDVTNQDHRERFLEEFSETELEYLDKNTYNGGIDWVAMPDEDQLMDAGFKGIVLHERSGKLSICLFDDADVEIVDKIPKQELNAIQKSVFTDGQESS